MRDELELVSVLQVVLQLVMQLELVLQLMMYNSPTSLGRGAGRDFLGGRCCLLSLTVWFPVWVVDTYRELALCS